MRIFRLANLFANKYSIQKVAEDFIPPPPASILKDIKRDLVNTFENHIMGPKSHEALLSLANAGEPFCKKIVEQYSDLILNYDDYSVQKIFNRVNNILGLINEIKSMDSDPVVDFIKSKENFSLNFRGSEQKRQQLIQKYQLSITSISYIFEQKAKVLKKFLPDDTKLLGGFVERKRAGLTKQQLRSFMELPAAQAYGLDDQDVMAKLMTYHDLREMITSLVLAIQRGHMPRVGAAVSNEVSKIRKLFREKINNEALLESDESVFKNPEIKPITQHDHIPAPDLEKIKEKGDEIIQEQIRKDVRKTLDDYAKEREESIKQHRIKEELNKEKGVPEVDPLSLKDKKRSE